MNKLRNSDQSENTYKQEIIGISIIFLTVFVFSAMFNGFDLLLHWISSSESYLLKNFLVAIILLSIALLFFFIKGYFDLSNEMKRTKQLEKNYERYRQYSDHLSQEINEMVFVLDHEMRIKFLNKQAMVRNPKAKGRYFYDTFSNFNYKLVEQHFQKAFRSRTVQRGIIKEKPKTDIHGGIKWSLTAIPILDIEGDTEEVIMIITFVSEIESNRPFRQALESYVNNSNLATIMLDADEKIIFWNKASEYLYGYNSSEMVSSSINKLILDNSHIYKNPTSLFKNNSKTTIRKTKSNDKKWIFFSRIPLLNRTGTDSGYMDVSYDITNIIEFEENMIYMIKFWESFPEAINITYCFIDDQRNVIVSDNTFFKISGLKKGDKLHTYTGEFVLELNKKQSTYKFMTKKLSIPLFNISGSWIYGVAYENNQNDINLNILESYLKSYDQLCFLESEEDGIVFISDSMKKAVENAGEKDPLKFLNIIKGKKFENDPMRTIDRFKINSSYEVQIPQNNTSVRYKIINIAFTEKASRFRAILFEKIEVIKPKPTIITEDYRKIYDALGFGLSIMEKDRTKNSFKIVKINKHLKKIEKQYDIKLLDEYMERIIPVGKYSEKFRTLNKVLKTGEPEHYEILLTDTDGKLMKWQTHNLFRLDDTHVIAAMIDIDKPIQEKREFKEEISYRNYLHGFNGIAYRLDLNLKPIFYIGTVLEITGYSLNELTNGDVQWASLIHKQDKDRYLEYRNRAISMTGNEYDIEYRIINKHNEELWISEHLQNTTDENGLISFIDGTIYNITKRKVAEIELKESRRVLRALTEHFESVREAEKKELAHEIHDDLGHALTVLKLDLAWVQNKKFIREDTLQERVLGMSKQIDQIIKKVRYISTELRPSILDHFGIIAAIEWKASEFQKRTAIRCRLSIEPSEINMDEHTSSVVFRIFQETMTNAARHANPSRIDVNLFIENNVFNLSVSDNGVGMKQETTKNNASLGLVGIRERAKFIGGEVFINSVVNFGTTITLRVPLKNQNIM